MSREQSTQKRGRNTRAACDVTKKGSKVRGKDDRMTAKNGRKGEKDKEETKKRSITWKE